METDFSKRVQDWVRQIPVGEVATYGEVARVAGSPGAARAVGTIMKKNTDATIPCHRVIGSGGCLGGYNGLQGQKAELLQQEGWEIKGNRLVGYQEKMLP